jgi:hypothetical protein
MGCLDLSRIADRERLSDAGLENRGAQLSCQQAGGADQPPRTRLAELPGDFLFRPERIYRRDDRAG